MAQFAPPMAVETRPRHVTIIDGVTWSSWTWAASGMQDHLAHRLAAGEHFQCIGGLRQRESAIDMGGDLALRGPLHEPLEVGAILVGIDPRPGAPENTSDIAALQQ